MCKAVKEKDSNIFVRNTVTDMETQSNITKNGCPFTAVSFRNISEI